MTTTIIMDGRDVTHVCELQVVSDVAENGLALTFPCNCTETPHEQSIRLPLALREKPILEFLSTEECGGLQLVA